MVHSSLPNTLIFEVDLFFDPLSWAIGFAVTKAAESVLGRVRELDLPGKLLEEVRSWAAGVPSALSVGGDAMFDQLLTEPDPASALANLRRELKASQIPSADLWYEAFVERWRQRHEESQSEELTAFFTAEQEEVEPHLRSLAERVNRVCAQELSLFMPTILARVEAMERAIEALTRPLSGWQRYGNWTCVPEGADDSYLIDDQVRIYDGTSQNGSGLQAADGINRLRGTLSTPGSVVRLAGLSGVGKTRLVAALFDSTIGENFLSPSLAVYSDIGVDPVPSPREMLETLIAKQDRVIVVVDNCPPTTHSVLAGLIRQQSHQVSLITVEYDVRSDEPEGTRVFHLEPSGVGLVGQLVRRRYPHLDEAEATTIAEVSGGNARIGLAIAGTVKSGESLSGFNDLDLFRRLFRQRQESDHSLLRTAEALSLCYSFDGEPEDLKESELSVLGALVDQSAGDVYRVVAELVRRDLVQKRGKMRAVLPHALANLLAKSALENIPASSIDGVFVVPGRDRILRSFSRRLGYLHDSAEARSIVSRWFSRDSGFLHDIQNLNSFCIELVSNVAPVSPDTILDAIERSADCPDGDAFTEPLNPKFSPLTILLKKIAYDTGRFERAVALLVRFARTENVDEKREPVRTRLKELFQPAYSGTQAPMEMRAKIVEKLVTSENPIDRQIGAGLLASALQTRGLNSTTSFDFGARWQGYGYVPQGGAEIQEWFGRFVSIASGMVDHTFPDMVSAARKCLADAFGGLWSNVAVHDELEAAAEVIRTRGMWIDGWLSARETLWRDSGKFSDAIRDRLERIIARLAPVELVEQARAFAFSNSWEFREVDEGDQGQEENSLQRHQSRVEKIAGEVALAPDVFDQILGDLVSLVSDGIYSFGRGLAHGGLKELVARWEKLTSALRECSLDRPNYACLCGFMHKVSESTSDLSDLFLDAALTDQTLHGGFVELQIAACPNAAGFERLMEFLKRENVEVWQFQLLAAGKRHEALSDDDLAALLDAISEKENGVDVCADILSMRFFGAEIDTSLFSKRLLSVGRDLLSRVSEMSEEDRSNMRDHNMARIAEFCLGSDISDPEAVLVIRRFADGVLARGRWASDFTDTLRAIAGRRPGLFLDAILCNSSDLERLACELLTDIHGQQKSPMSAIGDDDLLSWCLVDPASRFPVVATVVEVFEDNPEVEGEMRGGSCRLTTTSLRVLNEAPDQVSVLKKFIGSIKPREATMSIGAVIGGRRRALETLLSHENPDVVEFMREANSELLEREEYWRRHEAARDSDRDGQFE